MPAVRFYSFSKKVNSCKIPDGAGVSYNCELFNPCTVTRPVIYISGNDIHSYNYAYIPDFSRYYFVRDMIWDNGMWQAHLECDVLASYRDVIGSSSQYVLRSSERYNPGISDDAFPAYASPVYSLSQGLTPWSGGAGTYIIGVGGASGVQYYAMSEGNFNSLIEYIFSDEYAEQVLEGFEETFPELKAQLNPLQYIVSAMWVPFDIGGAGTLVSVGWVRTNAVGTPINTTTVPSASITFEVPNHPQGGKGSYLGMAPWSTYQLTVPPFGSISLPSDAMAYADSLYCEARLEPRNGMAVLSVFANDLGGPVIARMSGQIGIQLQLSQITAPGYGPGTIAQSALSIGAGIVGSVASIASGNPVSGISSLMNTASSAINTVGNIAASKIPSMNSTGSVGGGYAACFGQAQLAACFLPVVQKDIDGKGLPLCVISTPASLGGYMEIAWPRLDMAGTKEEKDAVLSYLRGGFYYE